MRTTELYQAHTIDAATYEAGRRLWGWTYLIDGDHHGEGGCRPERSESLALQDAIDEAKARIRHWLRAGETPARPGLSHSARP
jgi:hypothetical protein